MAFNFNWSPLTADASFYTRAQELLTTALNKSPKPPIIVDDIIVNELNLGSVPPELEILEIGDLAEDRFRGIFKMCYTGDAFLTLKTRVQVRVNPPANLSYASPSPFEALCYVPCTTFWRPCDAIIKLKVVVNQACVTFRQTLSILTSRLNPHSPRPSPWQLRKNNSPNLSTSWN